MPALQRILYRDWAWLVQILPFFRIKAQPLLTLNPKNSFSIYINNLYHIRPGNESNNRIEAYTKPDHGFHPDKETLK
jgi:hypothetical protein